MLITQNKKHWLHKSNTESPSVKHQNLLCGTNVLNWGGCGTEEESFRNVSQKRVLLIRIQLCFSKEINFQKFPNTWDQNLQKWLTLLIKRKNQNKRSVPEIDLDDVFEFVCYKMYMKQFFKLEWILESFPTAWGIMFNRWAHPLYQSSFFIYLIKDYSEFVKPIELKSIFSRSIP